MSAARWRSISPVLQAIPGGAAARYRVTRLQTRSISFPLYLGIANELLVKRSDRRRLRLGLWFSRNFRNKGMDRTHNPEFTVLEFYTAYKDYQ